MLTHEILQEKNEETIPEVTSEDYGQECILDFSDVPNSFFHKHTIRLFSEKLCDEINMRKGPNYVHVWGEDKQERKHFQGAGAIKADGISVSAVCTQFLYSSSITIHALDEIHKVFVNIFSCNKFDAAKAEKFCQENVGGKIVARHNIIRR
ncbi:S-adenosylmethionine decarboxylase [uncultured archaeon]|nr:S-adenosylmethionine decarboxylase [uncultured archaeon]